MRRGSRKRAFALYEVLIGLAIFVVGVLALGHSVENCLNANEVSEDENRVRQLLANRMAEIQSNPGKPDPSHETKIDTGYGIVRLIEKATPEPLEQPDNTIVSGINRVTLTAEWRHGGVAQTRQLVFYVYRAG